MTAVQIYGPLFVITHLVSRKSLLKVWKPILRSALFVSTFSAAFHANICLAQRLIGYNWPPGYFLSAALAGLSLQIEHPSRRSELAVYVTQVASELVYRMMRFRGWGDTFVNALPSWVPPGEITLYASAMSLLLSTYIHRPDSVSLRSLFDVFYGYEESSIVRPPIRKYIPPAVSDAVSQSFKSGLHHQTTSQCKHSHSCATHAVGIAIRGYTYGSIIRLLVNLVKILISRKFKNLGSLFKDCNNAGIFLGISTGGFWALRCLMRHLFHADGVMPTMIAGFISSFLAYSRFESRGVSLSTYFASKAVQSVFRVGVDKKMIRPIPHGDVLLYSMSVGLIFYAAVFEPHCLRPSYYRFLWKLGGGQFDHMYEAYRKTRHIFYPKE
eukprot:TRINITY_DN4793_c0_g1_i1.p1 TRINITY_DN4793_c0_g1~~TRINITY_DN4793_c0_g1_i1.p1  ORF type:complete len:427 (-),score=65.60 TRINITY_DN4793_c0_g1_i1:178-1326(-)